MKKVLGIYSAPRPHWVGDGFPVRSLFSYQGLGQHLSPFLLLDYAGPMRFEPAARPRGVGQHPHRGFETVTIVYEGEVEHRDSTGAGGTIGPGDVQWMTAASGILHEEFHSHAFTRTGGTLEMVQLWVNLPAKDKMAAPGYQTLVDADISSVPLPGNAGKVRIIAGEYAGHAGPARTFTAMNVWDVRLSKDHSSQFELPEGHTAALVVLHGTVQVNETQIAREGQLVMLDRAGSDVLLEANTDATVLLLSGEPIDEPIVGHGPFVMNSQAEIHQAIADFDGGRFGRMPH
ncbi:pirin family protein [Lysobacter sp. H23M47]|uniref:pirin family protein n=1 Tax=Lysobacter sp. H23M47 TaxID=2781024 RepID=UPI0018815E67|nr:pirin family protein [Lysobacter sp. H23M47]QOW23845.1 pirin family protein [Lysobacter sp. H23M47]